MIEGVTNSTVQPAKQPAGAEKITAEAPEKEQTDVQIDESRRWDRLELSNEYISAKNDNSQSQSESDEQASDSFDSSKLHSYTVTELKEFLMDGSISQSEYDAEIAKREGNY